jgi:flagellin
MARINTNVASLTAQRGLSKSQKAMDSTLQRLSTGLRINRGADDPSGLIASETLRSEISGINQAIDNSQRASNVISTAEGALSEVAALLLNVKGMVVQAANTGALSPDEISANQLQVDSAVQSITRIANTTTFAGLKLINGSMDYVTSGVDPAAMTALEITQANFGSREAIPVKVDVVTSAKPAELQFRGSAVASAVTLEVTGAEGVQVLQFTAGTKASAVAYAVNSISDSTGVRAELINSATPGSGIVFKSDQYGSRQFVSVAAQKGSFGTVDTAGAGRTRAVGQDASATVNGGADRRGRADAEAEHVRARAEPDPGRVVRGPARPNSPSPAAGRCSSSGRRCRRTSRRTSASSRSRPASSGTRASGS